MIRGIVRESKKKLWEKIKKESREKYREKKVKKLCDFINHMTNSDFLKKTIPDIIIWHKLN